MGLWFNPEAPLDYFDLLKELRKGTPDIAKSVKAMKFLGWACAVGAVWNFVIYFLGLFGSSPFNLPREYPYTALVGLLIPSVLFFFSARGVSAGEPWGKRIGQAAIAVLVILVGGFMYYFFTMTPFAVFRRDLPIVFVVFSVVFIAQFMVPAWFGMRYLERLPITAHSPAAGTLRQETGRGQETMRQAGSPHQVYKDALLPFGVIGTFALMLAAAMGILFLAMKAVPPQVMPLVFFPVFLTLFFGPALYNRMQSPFELQAGRKLIESCTGGGSIFLFNGSWPFFRLLVYQDGIELRVMLHRFFIPYDKLQDVPESGGFFSRGLLLRSDLPGVPSGIRFTCSRNKEVWYLISTNRSEYLATHQR